MSRLQRHISGALGISDVVGGEAVICVGSRGGHGEGALSPLPGVGADGRTPAVVPDPDPLVFRCTPVLPVPALSPVPRPGMGEMPVPSHTPREPPSGSISSLR